MRSPVGLEAALAGLLAAVGLVASQAASGNQPDRVPRTGGIGACEEELAACEEDLMTWGGSQVVKRVFVTSETFDGNLGGISGADAKCQETADTAGLGGTWKAWIAAGTPSSTPAARFTFSPLGYELLDGRTIGGTNLDLFPVAVISAVNVDENEQPVPDSLAWTGLNAEGTPAFRHCQGWASNSPTETGILGETSSTTFAWTIGASLDCDDSGRLYCFEQ